MSGNTDQYHWWRLRDIADQEFNPPLPAMLDGMLASVPEDQRTATRDNIHAIVSYTLGRTGGDRSPDQLRDACMSALTNRHDRDRGVATVAANPRFADYVLARVAEHVMANEAADMRSAMYGDEG